MPDKLQDEHQTELMTGYVLGSLSDAEKAEFEVHLATNPTLEFELNELQRIMGLMAQTVPPLKTPSHLRQRVFSSLPPATLTSGQPASRHSEFSIKANPASTGARKTRWSWEKIAAGVAALFIGGLGLQNYFLLQEILEYTDHGEPTTLSFTMKGSTVANASGNVLLDLETGRALFALQNLPPLSTSEVYSLWAFTNDKPILCGTFTIPASGQVVTQIPIPLDEYTESPVVSMRLFRGSVSNPTDLKNSVPIMISQI